MDDLPHNFDADTNSLSFNFDAQLIAAFTKMLLVCIFFLALTSLLLQYYKAFGPHLSDTIIQKFNLDGENNLPTFFSIVLLLMASLLLGLISFFVKSLHAPFQLEWKILSLVFLFLALDEAASLHEMLMTPLRSALNLSGFLYFSWVLPVGIGLFFFLMLYIPFLMHLPKAGRMLFLASGGLYVAGSMGVEMLGANYVSAGNFNPFAYSIFTAVEEVLEMSGIALFIYTLLNHLRFLLPGLFVYKLQEPQLDKKIRAAATNAQANT